MVAPQTTVDPTTTNKEEEVSQSMMTIQSTNLHLVPTIDQYIEPLQMLVQTLNNSELSIALSSLFTVLMKKISLDGSNTVFKKSMKLIMFQLKNSKKRKLTRKNFAQILQLPVSGTFYEVSIDQVLHMFNEMRHQPVLTGISHFKKSSMLD